MIIRSRKFQLFLLQASILALKVPFLTLGYGPEEDAWGHVYNIIEMYELGHYIVSRLPGHPAYEALMFLLFPLIKFPFIINLLSAIAAALAINEFYRICLYAGIRRPIFWTLAFALMPALFIGSTYAIDYSFTTWLILRATRKVILRRYFSAGLTIGVATAFRITSLAMLLPAVIYLYCKKERFRNYLTLALSALAVVLIFYSPAIVQYGLSFFDYHKPPGSGFLKAFYKFSFGALGLLGVAGFVALIVNALKTPLKEVKLQLTSPYSLYLLSAAVLFTFSYVMLPEKSAFTIPIYTFLLLWLASFEEKGYQHIGLTLLCMSLFLFGLQFIHPFRGADPSRFSITVHPGGQAVQLSPHVGLYVSEWQKRKNKMQYAETAYQTIRNLPQAKEAVIAGWWYAQLKTMEWLNDEEMPVRLIYYVNREELQELLAQGYQLRHLEELDEINDRLKNTNVRSISKPLNLWKNEQ